MHVTSEAVGGRLAVQLSAYNSEENGVQLYAYNRCGGIICGHAVNRLLTQ